MKLGFGLSFSELNLDGLKKLDQIFLNFISEYDVSVREELLFLRANFGQIKDKYYSEFLLKISPLLDDFLAELFNIQKFVAILKKQHKEFDLVYECKRKFVQRYAIKKYPIEKIHSIDFQNISLWLQQILKGEITERNFASQVVKWQLNEEKFSLELDKAAQYAAYMVHHESSALFNLPQKIDKDNLINDKKIIRYQKNVKTDFNYVNPFLNLEEALDQAHYCIYCHKQQKDSCSKGLDHHTGLRVNDIKREDDDKNKYGCPLKQKISEMNYVKARGFNLAALAIIIIDNPMVAATGHRICNDCSKACIYQKQDPVDIPLIESNILQDTLKLPYGLEIYLLLTRWNPLNIATYLPNEPTGYNILIAGLGPAGFSLSHYLLQLGHNVVAIDGLKITPIPFDITSPIKYWHEHKEELAEKIPQGFGGVAEYGITSRWDKNNLTILRLILERNSNFKYFSGIRLGSNITLPQAFNTGFDYVAICSGAGKPKVLPVNNFSAKGVRTASDFLMSLQSGGAFLKKSTTNLVIRMPIIIIGGGLTSIDAAVESLYYYKIQVEKFLSNYEFSHYGLNSEESLIAEEFIQHAKLFREANGDQSKIRQILEDLGGVTVYYRGNLKNSPAYRLNHEELLHAIATNVKFVENMQPISINVDEYNYVESIEFKHSGEVKKIKARTVIMSVGTEETLCINENNYADKISYFGDADPNYAGSVVKALASSKNGYKHIDSKLKENKPVFTGDSREFFSKLSYLLDSHAVNVIPLADKISEIVIHSPLAAKNFHPGQFFRLQNYSNNVAKLTEPLALTGYFVNPKEGLIHLIVLEVGNSSNLCKYLLPGEKVVLMGPTGTPTEILKDKNVILIGGGLGNAVLFSIGKALKENNCRITYFAGYKKMQDRFYPEKIEEVAETVVWCCEENILKKNRTTDISLRGNIIDAIKLTASKKLLPHIDRIICIGSAGMMESVKNIKNDYFGINTTLIVSVNSPMQCMMQGICGQCIQRTTENNYIFSCICQDQNAEMIDFSNLRSRLEQNSLLEKICR